MEKRDKLVDYDEEEGEGRGLSVLPRSQWGVMALCRKSKAVAKKTHLPGRGQCRQSRWQISLALTENWALGEGILYHDYV